MIHVLDASWHTRVDVGGERALHINARTHSHRGLESLGSSAFRDEPRSTWKEYSQDFE